MEIDDVRSINEYDQWILKFIDIYFNVKLNIASDLNWMTLLNNHVWPESNTLVVLPQLEVDEFLEIWLNLIIDTDIVLSLTYLLLHFKNKDEVDLLFLTILRSKILLSNKGQLYDELVSITAKFTKFSYWINDILIDKLITFNEIKRENQISPEERSVLANLNTGHLNLSEDIETFKFQIQELLTHYPRITFTKIRQDYDVQAKIKAFINSQDKLTLEQLNCFYALNLQDPIYQAKLNSIIEDINKQHKQKVKLNATILNDIYQEKLQEMLQRREKLRKIQVLHKLQQSRFTEKIKNKLDVINEKEPKPPPKNPPELKKEEENPQDTKPKSKKILKLIKPNQKREISKTKRIRGISRQKSKSKAKLTQTTNLNRILDYNTVYEQKNDFKWIPVQEILKLWSDLKIS